MHTVKSKIKEAFETSRKSLEELRCKINQEISNGSEILSITLPYHSIIKYNGIPLDEMSSVIVLFKRPNSEEYYIPMPFNTLYLNTKEWYDARHELYECNEQYSESRGLKLLDSLDDTTAIDIAYKDDRFYICRIAGNYTSDYYHPSKVRGTINTPLYFAQESYLTQNEYEVPDDALEYISKHLSPSEFETLSNKFPHIKEGLLEITDSRGRKVVYKPGRLLLSIAPHLDNEIIKKFAGMVQSFSTLEFHTSFDEEDFERIYIECENTGSCMDGDESQFKHCFVDNEFYHPARVYAHRDNSIFVAWATNGEDTIIARCLINTETREHTRVYFNDRVKNSEAKFRNLLQKQGYEFNPKCLLGQKLQKVTSGEEGIICPFIDPKNLGVKVMPTHLVVGGEYLANHDDGHLHDYPPESSILYRCSCCNSIIREPDFYAFTIDEEVICSDCIGEFVEVLDFSTGCMVYANKSQAYEVAAYFRIKLYGVWHESYRGSYVYNISGSDVYELDTSYYADNMVAHIDDCCVGQSGAVLFDDLDRFGLFFNEDDCDICEVDDYVVLDDELTYHSGNPKDDWEEAGYNDRTYPMLRNYITVDSEE